MTQVALEEKLALLEVRNQKLEADNASLTAQLKEYVRDLEDSKRNRSDPEAEAKFKD